MNSKSGTDLITTLEEWFKKAPELPKNVKELLVKYAPIMALIFGILGVLSSISGAGLLAVLTPVAMIGGAQNVNSFGSGFIAAIFWLGSSALLLAAYPGLKNNKMSGWKMLFWSDVVSFIGSLVSLSIVSGIVGVAIGFYFLFQIKSYYK